MKDLPHHIKKLQRREIRSEHRLEREDDGYLASLPNLPTNSERPKSQLRKQEKIRMRQEKKGRAPTPATPEERSKREKTGRVPIFDKLSHPHGPKMGARASKKKMPRI